jgi:hypothetical protein
MKMSPEHSVSWALSCTGHSVALGTQWYWTLSRRAFSLRALSRSGTQTQGTQSLHPKHFLIEWILFSKKKNHLKIQFPE